MGQVGLESFHYGNTICLHGPDSPDNARFRSEDQDQESAYLPPSCRELELAGRPHLWDLKSRGPRRCVQLAACLNWACAVGAPNFPLPQYQAYSRIQAKRDCGAGATPEPEARMGPPRPLPVHEQSYVPLAS